MRVRMQKVSPNLVPPESPIEPDASSREQITDSEVIIAPPPTNQTTDIMLRSTSAPLEALHQVLPRSPRRTRKSPKYYGFEKDYSSGELTNSCQSDFTEPHKKRRTGDVQSVQLSVQLSK